MNIEDLRELIQDDLLCILDALSSRTRADRLEKNRIMINCCQAVVDRFKEYEESGN